MHDLDGKSYRLLQNNLDNDIVADESKILVKKDKVIIKLQKVGSNEPACPPRLLHFFLCSCRFSFLKRGSLWILTDTLRMSAAGCSKLAPGRRVLVGLFLYSSWGVSRLSPMGADGKDGVELARALPASLAAFFPSRYLISFGVSCVTLVHQQRRLPFPSSLHRVYLCSR